MRLVRFKHWYRNFFSTFYLPYYAPRKSSKDTEREVALIKKLIRLKKGGTILDLACGTGRHAIMLAKMGFRVTGLDLDKGALKIARAAAYQSNTSVYWKQGDMRRVRLEEKFDAVICMFSSFGYFLKESDNNHVLRMVSRVLKPGGILILDLPNKQWMRTKLKKKTHDCLGVVCIDEEHTYQAHTHLFVNEIIIDDGKNVRRTLNIIHLYDKEEMVKKLKNASLLVRQVLGDYDGNPYRSRCSSRMIMVAQKQ